jgi:hypothetical protein
MSETSLNPLMTTTTLDRVINAFPLVAARYPLAQYMPLVNRPVDKITMDIDKATPGGMTPGVAPGTESPIVGLGGRARREWTSAHFREKVRVTELELIDHRKLGTQAELETAMSLLNRKFTIPVARLANRLEFMRRETLFDNQVTVQMADNTSYVVEFPRPADLQVTAGTLWSDTVNATPLDDLQLWVEDYQRYSGFAIKDVVAGMGFFRKLSACDEFKARAVNNTPGFTGSPAMVKSLVANYVGIPEIREETGRINFNAELTAASIATATTITLKNVDQIEAGDTIVLKRMLDLTGEKVVVASLAGNVVTLNAPLVLGYAVGDMAVWAKFTIPDGKLLFIGKADGMWEDLGSQATADADLIASPINIASTFSRHLDLEPRPGMFVKMIDRRKEDVASIEMVIGISAMVEVHYNEAWFTATYL